SGSHAYTARGSIRDLRPVSRGGRIAGRENLRPRPNRASDDEAVPHPRGSRRTAPRLSRGDPETPPQGRASRCTDRKGLAGGRCRPTTLASPPAVAAGPRRKRSGRTVSLRLRQGHAGRETVPARPQREAGSPIDGG